MDLSWCIVCDKRIGAGSGPANNVSFLLNSQNQPTPILNFIDINDLYDHNNHLACHNFIGHVLNNNGGEFFINSRDQNCV